MAGASPYALHEQLEVHEIAAFKTVCLAKTKTLSALVSDSTLKSILQYDIQVSTQQLQELSGLLQKTVTC